jgi:hypothetical protein
LKHLIVLKIKIQGKNMKRTTQLVGALAIATVLSTTASANGKVDVGYSSVDMVGTSKSGVSVGYGFTFGETIKQVIGLKVAFLGEDNDANEDKGNIGDFYYNIGYEVLSNTTAYASLGYGFQSLGTVGTGQNATTAYAGGMSTGAGIKYDFNKNFALDMSYKNYALSYEALDYDAKVINASIVYTFDN